MADKITVELSAGERASIKALTLVKDQVAGRLAGAEQEVATWQAHLAQADIDYNAAVQEIVSRAGGSNELAYALSADSTALEEVK